MMNLHPEEVWDGYRLHAHIIPVSSVLCNQTTLDQI